MKLHFTKMQGAGNDFVVLDGTEAPPALTPERIRALGDRHFGIGADQILVVERSRTPGVDFRYRIYNNSGEEVEHCGNGARCFLRYVHERGLTDKTVVRVETVNKLLELQLGADGRVTVGMGTPSFDLAALPFDPQGLVPRLQGEVELWPLQLGEATVELALVSMGNPHAVQRVADVDSAPVETQGPTIERHPRFARGVNAGFMQVLSRSHIRLRVFERGAGETLACGTGACAAVVAGVRLGWLDGRVDVDARGGRLTIEYADGGPVSMTGPAVTVFAGEIEL